MPEVQEVFRMATQKVRPEPGFVDRQQQHQRRKQRNRKIGAYVVAGTITAAALALILVTIPGDDESEPINTPTRMSDEAAVATAMSFLNAYAAFDAEEAGSYLTEFADITGLVGTQTATGEPENLPLVISLMEAQKVQHFFEPCEVVGTTETTTYIECPFEAHLFRSDDVGRGPFPGSHYELTIRDGQVAIAGVNWNIDDGFSDQMWEPFAAWVLANHPEDVTVMYEDDSQTNYRLTEESVRLWDVRLRQWANEVAG